ncbi:MAG: ABC transporter permease [Cyclobacteriaceae bacterium]|nr:ABC transporter permease [Cyclobacteriaceae bacterium]
MAFDRFKPPGYYIRRKLKRNKPALFGLVVIALAFIISLLGYAIMPDHTPDANDGAVQIQKQGPGFESIFLKIRKNRVIQSANFFEHMVYGQESEFIIVPITSYQLNPPMVRVAVFGKADYYKDYDLLDVVKALKSSNYELGYNGIGEEIYTYTNLYGQQESISQPKLIEEFETGSLEQRSYWLGTDKMGRDMLSRLLYGTRISLSIGFISVLISMFLGMSLGSLAGFFGGKVDMLILWFMSVIWSIPGIILVISISMALQSRGVWVAFVAVGLTMWVEVARVMRGQIMSIKEKLFVEAARAFGVKNFRIVFVHILPNIAGPLIVIATANFAGAILLEAGLSFLGLGVQPPSPSWGVMIYEGFQAIGTKNSLHLILFPALAICILVLAFNLLGNGLRDAYDPKTNADK